MHEIGYCEAVVEAVERRAAGRPVAAVGVRAGTLHRIVDRAFAQSFQLVAAGGVADGARTELELVPATGVCTTCGNRFPTEDPSTTCPSCGGFEVDLVGGDELTLAWVEYAPDPAAVPGPDPDPDPHADPSAGPGRHAAVDRDAERIPEHTHERT